MSQFDFIKDLAKYGLENDQEKLLQSLNELIEYSRKNKKINFALQLQSILKEGIRAQQNNGLTKVGSQKYLFREEDLILNDLIIEKITSDYTFENLVSSQEIKEELVFFVNEHKSIQVLQNYSLPVSNKLLFYGPSGCGKTLASYVMAGELEKMMVVINMGAVVSSKLGETSKNLAKIFRRAASEDCIIFMDEFDSLGKIRDYSQDHGEMKRVVNTILQLFDYLPQDNILIAATNQINMIDDALLRRFDLKINLELPNSNQIIELVEKTLSKSPFSIKKQSDLKEILQLCQGMSFYQVQKTLITAIKRTLFELKSTDRNLYVNTDIWKKSILQENIK